MLDPWIIEEIKRREQRRRIEQPVVQIPVQGPERDREPPSSKEKEEKEPPRGVEIIDFGVSVYGW